MNNNATPIRVGLVGVGNWARYGHISALRLLPGFSITAISSRSETRALAVAAEYDIPYALGDPRTLAEHSDVDLVAVLAPAPEHAAVVRMAVAAGKAVYCEWPLTVCTADSTELLALVLRAGVRHVVGLQRTVGASARYLQDLLFDGYVGQLRSVRMHVSVASFGPVRPPDLAWTLPAANFSHVLSIYGGHFMDMLFRAVGRPRTVGAVVATQFPVLELSGTGKTFTNETPDGIVVQGALENGALYQVQIEGGKRHNAGLQIDITGRPLCRIAGTGTHCFGKSDGISARYIETVAVDHRDYSPSQSLRLPALIRDLEIDYTALSLGVPQRVRFRYKLEGWDKEWQDPGVRRQAFYTNLSPRNYRFRVIASNDEGVWNEGGATLDFNIGAAFYQTTWFLVSCLLASALLLYLLYRFRVRQLAGQIKARMLERLSERERIARDLHDTFFQGIQGLLLRFNSATSQLAFNEPARAVFIETLEQSDRVMLEGRKLVLDLREVGAEVLELPESLARAGEEFNTLDGSEFRVVVVGQSRPLHRMCAGELYLLGREAIYNSFNHANASMIEVELDFETARLRLRITDNGSGIDDQVLIDGVRADHWGLTGMRERAQKLSAKLTIKSRKGAGTEIEVSVPASAAYLTESRTFLAEWYAKWMRRAKSPIIDRHG